MRSIKLRILLLFALLFSLAAHAEYPDHPIRLVVPFPAGSGTDNVARKLAEEMSKQLHQSIYIDNKPGAQGIIGVTTVTHAAADGYTLLLVGVTTGASNVGAFQHLPYDPLKDFTPIGMVADSPLVLVAAPDFPAKDTAGMFSYARANPGKLTYGYGSGSAQLAGAKLMYMGNLKGVPVPYPGSPQAMTDVMGGRVNVMFVDLSPALPQIKAGTLKALGVTTKDRFPLVPDIQTIDESGAPGYELIVWFGLAGPAKMPADVTRRLSSALSAALRDPSLVQTYANLGLAPKITTPPQFGDFLKSEVANWGALSKQAGIVPQ
ncbi:tripartite tricarboxylate transporter substrate binding protein [Burkholderia sp. L27(2015)]|jgi:tripartite-type tricarboxylate transporter receptor subunit TctC|uniref:Bug family tripartite tricarboxylate transporter substrate binding protein n=1 Tax=Burkholderia sp. L27(2015) TaxID=1641858 RepID=UPI00131DE057|nr:tripartite tricarboxylate transporter substrate binding protein [Burkholderia sp. L27(2015)]